MSAALLIYMILTPAHRWEFLAIERSDSRAYCEVIAVEVERLFADQPGNIRILCVDDDGGEA